MRHITRIAEDAAAVVAREREEHGRVLSTLILMELILEALLDIRTLLLEGKPQAARADALPKAKAR